MNVYKLTFTQEQMSLLNQALIEMPFKVVALLIQDINQQIQSQLAEQKTEE